MLARVKWSVQPINQCSLCFRSGVGTIDAIATKRLNYKSLHAHSIETECQTCLNDFSCDSSSATITTLGLLHAQLPNWEGDMCVFKDNFEDLEHFKCENCFKGNHKRLEDSHPNVDLNDSIIEWMTEFVTWLHVWKAL